MECSNDAGHDCARGCRPGQFAAPDLDHRSLSPPYLESRSGKLRPGTHQSRQRAASADISGQPAKPVALIGLAAVLWDRERREARALLIAWGLTAVGLFLYGWLLQLMPGHLLSVVPQFHFYFYIRALGYLLAGVGIWNLIRLVVSKLAQPRWTPVLSSLAVTAMVTTCYVVWSDDFH